MLSKEKRYLRHAAKKGWIPQVAALPYRIDRSGNTEILLITSRRTKRFIVPKGWQMKGKTDPEAAMQEAKEEAGVSGIISRQPIGQYFYWKELERMPIKVRVTVYALAVTDQLIRWPEDAQRSRIWVHPDRAALMVSDPPLIPIIKRLSKAEADIGYLETLNGAQMPG
jgi:8-oxo-dGTP pyrophosphatase MutT (NUDIX family)